MSPAHSVKDKRNADQFAPSVSSADLKACQAQFSPGPPEGYFNLLNCVSIPACFVHAVRSSRKACRPLIAHTHTPSICYLSSNVARARQFSGILFQVLIGIIAQNYSVGKRKNEKRKDTKANTIRDNYFWQRPFARQSVVPPFTAPHIYIAFSAHGTVKPHLSAFYLIPYNKPEFTYTFPMGSLSSPPPSDFGEDS